jgi:flagellar basal-body rod protein FlgF
MSGIEASVRVGMLNDVERLRIISQNLANVGTVGYKRQIAVTQPFDLQLQGATAARAAGEAGPVVVGYSDRTPGTLAHTGNPLDLAIEGDAYFVVERGQQEVLTRQGTLRLDGEGRLVSVGGHPVMTTSGAVRLTGAAPAIGPEGDIRDNGGLVGQLKVMSVSNPESMIELGNGMFAPSEGTTLEAATSARIRQGYTETANVTAMNEMIGLIDAVRHFETSQKLLKGYDGMLERALSDLGSFQ